MKARLGTSEHARAGMVRINRELCERARRIIGDSSTFTDNTIFELRRSVKKLRAVLRVTRPVLGKKAFRELNRLMGDFSRQLGRPRDSAVLIETFDSLLEHFQPYPSVSGVAPARYALCCRHQAQLEDFVRSRDTQFLASGFSVIEERVRNLDLQRLTRQVLLSGILKTYRRCRSRLQSLHDVPSTDNSHELRRQVKYAWNQLKLVRKWGPDTFRPVIADLQRLGGLLGRDSNLALLVETLQQHPEICCTRIRTEFIVALAEARRTALLSASLRLADRIFAATPQEFGLRLEKGTGGSRF